MKNGGSILVKRRSEHRKDQSERSVTRFRRGGYEVWDSGEALAATKQELPKGSKRKKWKQFQEEMEDGVWGRP